jgi:hypothetical protein
LGKDIGNSRFQDVDNGDDRHAYQGDDNDIFYEALAPFPVRAAGLV